MKRVQDKLVERGYIPNMAATLLARNNSRIIGVVIHDHPKYEGHLLEDPFVAGALNALSKEIADAGYFLMLKTTDAITEAEPFASMWNMDGMVLMGFCADEYQTLRNRIRIPFVVYDGFFENKGNICNLMLDDHGGGYQVGEYYRKMGHERILCIADNELFPDYDRYLGLCEGLGKKADLWQIPMKQEERRAFYENNRKELLKYTAIFAVSDYYAADIMRFLSDIGVRVPEDISVVGFDDTMLSRTVKPALSTVRQDVAYRAKRAVEYLMKIRDDRNYSATIKIPVELVIRESSGRVQ